VFTLGDDTLGQCGLGSNNRKREPPFNLTRVNKFTKVPNLPSIQKIACGSNHVLALSKENTLFGWGSNSSLQLSHEEEFSQVNEPLITAFEPIKISKKLEDNTITDIAGGKEFSIIVTQNNKNKETEVFGMGNNLSGQLGVGSVTHIQDIILID